MNNTTKRLLAVVCMLAMLLAFAMPAMAEPDVPTVTISTATVESSTAAQDAVVTLSIKDNTGGLAGVRIKVAYDSALTLKTIENGFGHNAPNDPDSDEQDAGQGLSFTPPGNLEENPIYLLWDGMEADATNGTLATLTFTVAANAAEGEHSVTATYAVGDVYDGNLEDVELNVVNGGVTVTAPAPSYMPGDIDGNGKVNAKDVTRFAQYVAKWDVEVVEAALDVDGNGKVNAKDVTRLAQYVAKWDVEIH